MLKVYEYICSTECTLAKYWCYGPVNWPKLFVSDEAFQALLTKMMRGSQAHLDLESDVAYKLKFVHANWSSDKEMQSIKLDPKIMPNIHAS